MPDRSDTSFEDLAKLFEQIEATTKRTEKVKFLSEFLLRVRDVEIPSVVCFTVGWPFPESDARVLEVSWQTMPRFSSRDRQMTLLDKQLTIQEVQRIFDQIAGASGSGSKARKRRLLEALLSKASPVEADYLTRIIFGEMRIGAVEGIMIEAIAAAAKVDPDIVRRANMLRGDISEVGSIALLKGEQALRSLNLRLLVPIKPMLAEMSYEIREVFAEHGGKTAFEYKYDGARIQIHKHSGQIRVFSRRLTDVTESLPDIVELARSKLRAEEFLIEGEVVAVGRGGKPVPFQDLMRRFRRVHEVQKSIREIPLRLYLFDIIYLNGKTLIDEPYRARWDFLASISEADLLARRVVTSEESIASDFLKEALAAGHEGLMAKALESDYAPGVRGKKWFKIKPADRLDVAIVAADWGSGRRRGWLSNYHLAVRDEESDEWLVVGKTFKGLTDEEFEMMTKTLQSLKVHESKYSIRVRPSVVVEVAYNEIQKSPHYKSGFALRFARIMRIREDRLPDDANTIQRLRELYEKQFVTKEKLDVDRNR